MKITIAGLAGSGKSSVAKKLASKLGFKHYSTGDFMRQMAHERGLDIVSLGKIAEKDKSVDKELDDRQILFGKNQDNFVIDGRLSWHFIPDSVKIFLDCSEIRFERVFKDKRSEEKSSSLNEMKKSMLAREKSEHVRYKKYYGLDYLDLKNYDLVIDTSKISIDEVVSKISAFLKTRL